MDTPTRCRWATDPLLIAYHDEEWGHMPQTDHQWLEMIVLETFQAGLSWKTILHRRQGFRLAFHGFEVDKVAAIDTVGVERLMQEVTIIRNRKKIEATVENAKIVKRLIEGFGSVGSALTQVPEGELYNWLQRTFRFVGRTTAESIAFATGLVPAPHDADCWLHSRA